MKYKIGDIVQTTSKAWIHPRKVGEIIEVVKEDYRVQLLAGGRFWFTESELRPYKKKSERKKERPYAPKNVRNVDTTEAIINPIHEVVNVQSVMKEKLFMVTNAFNGGEI